MGKKIVKLKWMSYDAAKTTVQQLASDVKTRTQYWKWWDKHRPTGIPKYPNRVYIKQWTSWSDFLDSENMYFGYISQGRNFRDYWEAVKFVQPLNIKTVGEYRKRYKNGEIPKDIPLSPNTVYQQWRGWKLFLGVDAQNKLQAAKQNTTAWALCDDNDSRYIKIVTDTRGKAALLSLLKNKCYKVYRWDTDKHDVVKNIMFNHGTIVGDKLWVIGNINALLFDLDNVLDEYD